jgi:hypothetical protein
MGSAGGTTASSPASAALDRLRLAASLLNVAPRGLAYAVATPRVLRNYRRYTLSPPPFPNCLVKLCPPRVAVNTSVLRFSSPAKSIKTWRVYNIFHSALSHIIVLYLYRLILPTVTATLVLRLLTFILLLPVKIILLLVSFPMHADDAHTVVALARTCRTPIARNARI